MKIGALLATIVLAACATGSVDPRATPQTPIETARRSAATSAPSTDPIALFDAHVHYSADARQRFTIDEVLAILREAGVRRALVS
ncbi:MAG: hypothetical protein ACRDF9_13840, partial [Candidatus Limnocylindria bacterium]